ncbi:SAM-dependent methyltransferase [Aphanothece hegewaldii CCALA 016]|uniref:SAM-dependent methyltransferase n=1 Tax=Aphanothece hegewaldii CCALA 016 TaxID=2107694 RepID=A0A2T1LRB7_9CHRO|nr:N-6 DNA methylase [Aphanothece hegewaldii]PSF31162.1 SAM-dependent methyltransferase [Aphanothece hegewaldii CCALA 016]
MNQKFLQQQKIEFGDFQTPQELTDSIVQLVKTQQNNLKSIIEPSCGTGNFIISCLSYLSEVDHIIGAEINQKYLDSLNLKINTIEINTKIHLIKNNFFIINWSNLIKNLLEPILIIGNPPWVTNSKLGSFKSSNLPSKNNFQNKKGLDAITGKSNFDISEWMILQYLEWLHNKNGVIAVLCKTSVARKILIHVWSNKLHILETKIYSVNALKYFAVSVDACLLIIKTSKNYQKRILQKCLVYPTLLAQQPINVIGFKDNFLISNLSDFENLKFLYQSEQNYCWRSGIKHDCAKIMELEKKNDFYYNGYSVQLDLEDLYIYPLLKSSDLNNNFIDSSRKNILVTQHYPKQDTTLISKNAPKTWNYLQENIIHFLNRKSSIYKNSPNFSIFGIGDYSFAPWKVAISGFYKSLKFRKIGSLQNKPVIFDDTVYFLPCYSESEAIFLCEILNSDLAQKFLESMIFWNDKRPITVNLLKRLSLSYLARELKREEEYLCYTK